MISVIIIVKNDPGIDRTLSSLLKINKPEKTEIIVVDASEGKLDYIKDKYNVVKWYDFFPKDRNKITIPQQRNLGIKKSKGDIIVFIDAGCIPDNDWLVKLLNPIYKENDSMVAGKTLSEGKSTIHDQSVKINIKRRYIEECPTLNFAIKREVIRKVGNFDESFECGEDVDFCWRAREFGYRIRYAKEATITHNWGNWMHELKRTFWYGTARVNLYKKHTGRIKYLFTHDFTVLIYPLFILGLPLTLVFPFYPLLLLVPLIKNRQDKPIHIIIDHLVYGFGILKQLITLS